MASEPGRSRSDVGRLVNHREGDITLFIPFIFLGVSSSDSDETSSTEPADVSNNNNDSQTETPSDREFNSDTDEIRVVLVNPLNRSFIVLQGASSLEALFTHHTKTGLPPATAASIESLPEVEIGNDDHEDVDCAICLDDMKKAKMMPCKHVFHSGCVEKWLKIHGSCPVCRFQMPFVEQGTRKGGDEMDSNRQVEREIWIPFSVQSSNQETEDHQSLD